MQLALPGPTRCSTPLPTQARYIRRFIIWSVQVPPFPVLALGGWSWFGPVHPVRARREARRYQGSGRFAYSTPSSPPEGGGLRGVSAALRLSA